MLSWVAAHDFNITSQRITCPGSTGTVPRRTVLASRVIPNGARCRLGIFSAKVVDLANSDQVFFAVERNGTALLAGFERIPGIQFDYQAQQDLMVEISPGLIELVAYNISGASQEPEALPAATDIRCQAWLQANLLALREVKE